LGAPALEIGLGLRRALAHGHGVDQVLEALGERLAHGVARVVGLDERGNAVPAHHAIVRHAPSVVRCARGRQMRAHSTESGASSLTKRRPPPTLPGMIDTKTADQELQTYLRPQTFP